MPKNETRWLLEMNEPAEDGKPRYFISAKPFLGYLFTDKPQDAMWWTTAEDADSARLGLSYCDRMRVTEHIFTGG